MSVKKINVVVFLVLLFLLCSGTALAQAQRNWWHTLERGKQMFRQGDFGNALLVFEDARRQRKAMYDRMERDFIDLLSLYEVRRMGDSLDWVERFIQERRYIGAAAALEELYYRIPRSSFDNSVSIALAALQTLGEYPEAEFWIGEIYLVEGEFTLALNQFQKAYELRSLLENPGFTTELLHRIADIHRIRQDFNEMEQALLSIIEADSLWTGGIPENYSRPEGAAAQSRGIFVRQAMTRTLENNGIDRFLTLYRYNNNASVNAHRLLGYYYYTNGRHARAQEHLMFAFLIQNTIIIEELMRTPLLQSTNLRSTDSENLHFTFTTLENLAVEINRNRRLGEFTENIEYYKTAYYLGSSLYANGRIAPAMELWNFLAAQDRAGEWQIRAIGQLRSPHIEQLVEIR